MHDKYCFATGEIVVFKRYVKCLLRYISHTVAICFRRFEVVTLTGQGNIKSSYLVPYPVQTWGVGGFVVAPVSPDPKNFHEFRKHDVEELVIFYMCCQMLNCQRTSMDSVLRHHVYEIHGSPWDKEKQVPPQILHHKWWLATG